MVILKEMTIYLFVGRFMGSKICWAITSLPEGRRYNVTQYGGNEYKWVHDDLGYPDSFWNMKPFEIAENNASEDTTDYCIQLWTSDTLYLRDDSKFTYRY